MSDSVAPRSSCASDRLGEITAANARQQREHHLANVASEQRAASERAANAAAYEALPPMDTSLLTRWVRGEIEDGASSGYRLPEQISASDLSAMLRRIPPTVHVVTKGVGRHRAVTLRLASRPAWRLGTDSRSVPGNHGWGAGTAFSPVMLFEDGTERVISQVGGNGSDWYLDDSQYTRPTGLWKGDRASSGAFDRHCPKD